MSTAADGLASTEPRALALAIVAAWPDLAQAHAALTSGLLREHLAQARLDRGDMSVEAWAELDDARSIVRSALAVLRMTHGVYVALANAAGARALD